MLADRFCLDGLALIGKTYTVVVYSSEVVFLFLAHHGYNVIYRIFIDAFGRAAYTLELLDTRRRHIDVVGAFTRDFDNALTRCDRHRKSIFDIFDISVQRTEKL